MSRAIPIKYEYRGKQYTVAELAKFARVDSKRLRDRLGRQKWSVERAVETGRLSLAASGRISAQKPECRTSVAGNYLPERGVNSQTSMKGGQ